MEQQVCCQRVGHQNAFIQHICLQQDCQEVKACCQLCIQKYHSKHVKFLEPLNIVKSRDPFYILDAIQKLKQSVLEFFEKMETAYKKILPIFPQQINISSLNQYANKVAFFKWSKDQNNSHYNLIEKAQEKISKALKNIKAYFQKETQESIDLRRNEASKLKKIGDKLLEAAKYAEADKVYNMSIDIFDEDCNVWNNKGVCLQHLLREEEAINSYSQAININPRDCIFYRNKANCLNGFKKYESALIQANKSLELNPEFGSSWNAKGVALEALNRQMEALECYKNAVKFEPNHFTFIFNLARTLDQLGQKLEAQKYYQDSLKINPNFSEAKKRLQILKYELNQF